MSWRDLAADLDRAGHINAAAPAEVLMVRRTVENLAKRGQIERASRLASGHSRRPLNGWVLRAADVDCTPADVELANLMNTWRTR